MVHCVEYLTELDINSVYADINKPMKKHLT